MALHHEEFTWPHLLPNAPVSSYLTVSPITSCEAGLFSVALVVTRFPGRPVIIRLAALWCSDFPLLLKVKAITRRAPLQGSMIIAKFVQQINAGYKKKLFSDLYNIARKQGRIRSFAVADRPQIILRRCCGTFPIFAPNCRFSRIALCSARVKDGRG